jgi:hypothetical protein
LYYYSIPVQTGSETHTVSSTMGTESLFWRLSGRGVALPSGEVKKNVELNLSLLCIFVAYYR